MVALLTLLKINLNCIQPRYTATALLCLAAIGCSDSHTVNHQYDYRVTRHLVQLMQNAAKRLEQQGSDAFSTFRNNPDKWTYRDAYLYVYTTNGYCMFHAGMPELEGKNLIDLEDAAGRRMINMVMQAVTDPIDPDGWVHYWWNLPNRLYPVWKSSCHSLVTLPNGQQVFIGAGMANLPRERVFVKRMVDSAVQLLNNHGTNALEELEHPFSRYKLPGSSLFVVAEDGTAIISPSFQIEQKQNILDCQDDAGHRPLREAFQRLEKTNAAWTVLLARSHDSMNLHKKGLYVRKAKMGTNVVYAAATADLPVPAWMH